MKTIFVTQFFLMLFYLFPSTCIGDVMEYEPCWRDSGRNVYEAEIIQLIEKLSLTSDQREKLSIRSQCYMQIKDYISAIEDLDALLDIDPDFPYAHHFRGKAYYLSGYYDKAISDFKFSIEIGTDNPDDYVYISKAYSEQKQYSKAEEYLDEGIVIRKRIQSSPLSKSSDVVRVDISEVSLYKELSRVLLLQDRTEKAKQVLMEGLQRNNGAVELFDALMEVLRETDQISLYKQQADEMCRIPLIMDSKHCITTDK